MSPAQTPYASRSSLRERWAAPFLQYPLLHFLASNPIWTALVLAALLALAGAPLAVVKMWRSTPPGFMPRVRVSALDLFQAWSLKRAAEHSARIGDLQAADRSWRAAIRQNLGDARLLRGGLSNIVVTPDPDLKGSLEILSYTVWLLHLKGTNQADVHLATQVFAKLERWSELEQILRPRADRLTPEEQQSYLSALFWLGKADDFGCAWESAPEVVRESPSLRLCHWAYLAGWAAPDRAGKAREQLESVLQEGEVNIRAHRANLVVRSHLLDLLGYEQSLHRLEDVRADRLIDWIRYARLLDQSGRTADARRLAEEKSYTTSLPWEVLDLAALLSDLGMKDTACSLLRRATTVSGHSRADWSVSLWAMYGNLLAELRRWDELEEMIMTLHAFDPHFSILGGHAHFLQGRALQAKSHHELAELSFQKAAHEPFPMPGLGLQAGVGLLQLGYPQLAEHVLKPLENALREDPCYWQALAEAAFLLKTDSVAFFKAAREAYRLLPEDPLCQNNYAAALLLNRWAPEEAVPLTLQILHRDPGDPKARINHAFALILSRRYAEAAACLTDMDVARLDAEERDAYDLASLEINVGLGRLLEARAGLDHINTDRLFPSQVEWLAQLRQRLPDAPPTPQRHNEPVVSR